MSVAVVSFLTLTGYLSFRDHKGLPIVSVTVSKLNVGTVSIETDVTCKIISFLSFLL
jgi:hypothetical protein